MGRRDRGGGTEMAAEDSSKDSSSRARKMMMRSSRDDSSYAHGGVYEDGPYKAHTVSLEQQRSSCGSKHNHRVGGGAAAATNETDLPPKPLLIAVPKAKGKYPVVQFQHGFTLQNHFYSQLLLHLASHGFIVVAPQVRNSLSLPLSGLLFQGFGGVRKSG